MRDDCGQCPACADKPRFGGRGSKKKVENRLRYLQKNNSKIKRNNCKIMINDCKIEINNFEIKVNNVKAVCGMIAVSARPVRTSLDLEAEAPKRR